MKTVGIREAKASLSAYIARAQRERVPIMKHGKPAALVTAVSPIGAGADAGALRSG